MKTLEAHLIKQGLLAINSKSTDLAYIFFWTLLEDTGKDNMRDFLKRVDFKSYIPVGVADESNIFTDHDIEPVSFTGDDDEFSVESEMCCKMISFAPVEFQSRALAHSFNMMEAIVQDNQDLFDARYTDWVEVEEKHGSPIIGLLSLAKQLYKGVAFFAEYADDLEDGGLLFQINKSTPNILGYTTPIKEGESTDQAILRASKYKIV